MTRIDFYTQAQNRLQIACVLTAKAVTRGMRVRVYTPDEATTSKLDNLLWSASATGFLPHCRAADPLAGETPVIVDHSEANINHDEVLINLHPDCPPFFSRFSRLIEIIGLEQEELQAGRTRFRFYRDRGYEIHSHDIGKKALD